MTNTRGKERMSLSSGRTPDNWKQKYQMVCDEMQVLVNRYSDAKKLEEEALGWEKEAHKWKREHDNLAGEVKHLRYLREELERRVVRWWEASRAYRRWAVIWALAFFISAIGNILLAVLRANA